MITAVDEFIHSDLACLNGEARGAYLDGVGGDTTGAV